MRALTPQGQVTPSLFFASPRGGVGPSHLHKRGHCILFACWLVGGRGWGWAGRRLCRPPAGEGVGCAPLPGRWGGRKVGRFLRKHRGRRGRLGDPALPGARRGWVRPARRSEPYLGGRRGHLWTERTRFLSGGGRPRGPRRRVEASGGVDVRGGGGS
jgi:hypothetical protein